MSTGSFLRARIAVAKRNARGEAIERRENSLLDVEAVDRRREPRVALALDDARERANRPLRERREQLALDDFARPRRHALERARGKLEQKGLDVLVANDVSEAETGFDALDNEVLIITRAGQTRLSRAPKPEIAEGILDVVEQTRAASEATVRGDARRTRGRRLRALPSRL